MNAEFLEILNIFRNEYFVDAGKIKSAFKHFGMRLLSQEFLNQKNGIFMLTCTCM
jgi:hypothetical protein